MKIRKNKMTKRKLAMAVSHRKVQMEQGWKMLLRKQVRMGCYACKRPLNF